MVDFYTALYAIFNVAAASWVHLGKKPEIIDEEKNRSDSPNIGMKIEELEPEEHGNDHQGTKLYGKQKGRVLGWFENRTDRENFILDIQDLYEGHDSGEIISSVRMPYVERYEAEIIIERCA